MGKKIDTKLDADMQASEAAQVADPISDDGSHGDINNAAAAEAESEILASEQIWPKNPKIINPRNNNKGDL